jgi:hypothetical protein
MMSTSRIYSRVCSSLSNIVCYVFIGALPFGGAYGYANMDNHDPNTLYGFLYSILFGMTLGALYGIREECKECKQVQPPAPPPVLLPLLGDQKIQVRTFTP